MGRGRAETRPLRRGGIGNGPAGTVVAFHPGTFHRGTELRAPHGARYSMHLNYRPATVEWGHRYSWADRSHMAQWY